MNSNDHKQLLDTDRLTLTKSDVLRILDNCIGYLKRHPIQNAKMIASLTLFKLGVYAQSEQDVKNTWALIIRFIDALRVKNAYKSDPMLATINEIKRDLLESPESIAKEIFAKEFH